MKIAENVVDDNLPDYLSALEDVKYGSLLEELAAEIKAIGAPMFLVGDGAELTHKYLSSQGLESLIAPENLRWQSAWGVAMAAEDKEPGNADSLLPVYLRLSQAERERNERLARENN